MKKFKSFIYYFFLHLFLIFIILSINVINAQFIQKDIKNLYYHNNKTDFYDQLDQYQRNYTIDQNNQYENYKIFYKNTDNYQWCAQSFKPSLKVLTKVNLLIYKLDINCVLILSIRKELDGYDLVVMSKGSEEISEIENIKWVTFDFPDINVLVNETYYIIAKCYCGYFDIQQNNISCYLWVFGIETSYTNGGSWIIKKPNINDWEYYQFNDFCFETYGCSNRPPNNPKIEGPITGIIDNYYEYTFKSTDPDNDDIYYCVIGGESNSEICLGPYNSGAEAKATFSWQKRGSYTVSVKARDINGAESEWVTLEVKMPISYFQNFFKKFNFISFLFNLK